MKKMNDEYGDNEEGTFAGILGFFGGLPSFVLAALIFALPFMIVDFFNYYSAGTALVLSTPVLAILYGACGALAGKLAADQEGSTPNFLVIGATAGVILWLTSTVVNTIISLIIGAASLGTTLLLGIPYLCLCAPFQFIGGGLMGGLGGFIYSLFYKRSNSDSEAGDYIG
jgi:hypothetical protein